MSLKHSVNVISERYQPQLEAAGRTLRTSLAQAQADAQPAFHTIGQLLRTRRLPDRVPIALKLAFAFAFLIASGMIVLGVLVGTNQTSLLEQQMNLHGATQVQQLAESAREPLLANDNLNLELLTHNLTLSEGVMGAAVFDEEMKLTAREGAVPALSQNKTEVSTISKNISVYRWDLPKDGIDQALISYLSPISFRDITVGYTLITFDYSLLSYAKYETIATVVSTVFLMLLITTGVSYYLGQRFTRPINKLVEVCEAYSTGQYEHRIHENRNDEIGVLMESLNGMGESLLRKEQVEQVFSRYVSPQVARRAIEDIEHTDHLELGGRHVTASVLFADIVGFTSISETMSPQEISTLLNLYFSNIARVVHFCHGHIDKYMGDCAMIVFGVPEEHEEHAFYSLSCAWMILELVRQMNQLRSARGLTTVEFRIGVNSGSMLAGNMGSAERMEYTVVGDSVNLASRLSHAGVPGQVIVTGEMLDQPELVGRIVTTHRGKIKLRGKKEQISIFHIRDIHDPFRANMLEEIRNIVQNSNLEVA